MAGVNDESGIAAGGSKAYDAKSDQYFSGARRDYIDALPVNPQAAILEIGCGEGNTGALALAQGKCGKYCGVELCEGPAANARKRISDVVVGDVERLDLPWNDSAFDALIMSEVLEHLVDPWAVLRKLRPLLKSGAMVFASSPNISHYRIIRMLVSGRWDLADQGVMDRTHLRWFTPKTFREMFETCGFIVDRMGPLTPLTPRERMICASMGGWGEHLFTCQINLHGHRD